jgi:hypothetical protein
MISSGDWGTFNWQLDWLDTSTTRNYAWETDISALSHVAWWLLPMSDVPLLLDSRPCRVATVSRQPHAADFIRCLLQLLTSKLADLKFKIKVKVVLQKFSRPIYLYVGHASLTHDTFFFFLSSSGSHGRHLWGELGLQFTVDAGLASAVLLGYRVPRDSLRYVILSFDRYNKPSSATLSQRPLLTRISHYMFRLIRKPSSGVSYTER